MVLCDNPEGWVGGERRLREGICVYSKLTHTQQKPVQHCKAIVHQLKINNKSQSKPQKYKES